jgi:hypothetical protein
VNYYNDNKIPNTPRLRRSTANWNFEKKYIEHQKILDYYQYRCKEIAEVYNLYVQMKCRKKMLELVFNSQSEHTGIDYSFAIELCDEYLKIKKKEFFYDWDNEKKDFKLLPERSSKKIVSDNKIYNKDPRIKMYQAIELVPHLRNGYNIISNGREYLLLSSSSENYFVYEI